MMAAYLLAVLLVALLVARFVVRDSSMSTGRFLGLVLIVAALFALLLPCLYRLHKLAA